MQLNALVKFGILVLIMLSGTNDSECVCISRTYTATTSIRYIRKTTYSNNEDCYFHISPSSSYRYGYFLEIVWYYRPSFSVKGDLPNCTKDYLEIYLTSSYKSIGKYCSNNLGNYTPFRMPSPDGKAKIKFHSDSSGFGSGFQLRYRMKSKSSYYYGSYYKASCYNTYSLYRSRSIYSSGWPRGYKSSTYSCTHKINAGSNRETRLVFTDMDLNYYGSRSICSSLDDYVEVRGTDSSTATFTTSSYISGKLCISTLIKTIITRKKYIYVYFRRRLGSAYTGRRGFFMGYISYDLVLPTPTPPAVSTNPFIIRHIGGLCVAKHSSGRLYLTTACNEAFSFTSSKSLKHQTTNKCVVPESLTDNAYIKLSSNCNTADSHFEITSGFSMKHIKSGKCFHPLLGSSTPAVNTMIVIYTGCNFGRLIFKLEYLNLTNSASVIAPTAPKTSTLSTISSATTEIATSSIAPTASAISTLSTISSATTEIATSLGLTTRTFPDPVLRWTHSVTEMGHYTSNTQQVVLATQTAANNDPSQSERISKKTPEKPAALIAVIVPVIGVIVALLIIAVIARYCYKSRRPLIGFGNADVDVSCKSENPYSKDPTISPPKGNFKADRSTTSPPALPTRPSNPKCSFINRIPADVGERGSVKTSQVLLKMRSQSLVIPNENKNDVDDKSSAAFEQRDGDDYLSAVQLGVTNAERHQQNHLPAKIIEGRNEEFIMMKPITGAMKSTRDGDDEEEHYLDLTQAAGKINSTKECDEALDEEEHYLDLTQATAHVCENEGDSVYEDIEKFNRNGRGAKLSNGKMRSITFDEGSFVPTKSNKQRSVSIDVGCMKGNTSCPSFLLNTKGGRAGSVLHAEPFPKRPKNARAPCPPPAANDEALCNRARAKSIPWVKAEVGLPGCVQDEAKSRRRSMPGTDTAYSPSYPFALTEKKDCCSKMQAVSQFPTIEEHTASVPQESVPSQCSPSCQHDGKSLSHNAPKSALPSTMFSPPVLVCSHPSQLQYYQQMAGMTPQATSCPDMAQVSETHSLSQSPQSPQIPLPVFAYIPDHFRAGNIEYSDQPGSRPNTVVDVKEVSNGEDSGTKSEEEHQKPTSVELCPLQQQPVSEEEEDHQCNTTQVQM